MDGLPADGTIGLAFRRRDGGGLEPLLEVENGEFVVTSPPDGVRSVEVLSSMVSMGELAQLAAQWIERPSSIPPGDEVYWDVPIGSHELLEISIKRTRVSCTPGGDQ